MRRSFQAYLYDIFQSADNIDLFMRGVDRELFTTTREKQAAVEREFEIMGEAISQCRKHYPLESAALGDVQGVVDFRNFLAHRYHVVAADIVWDIFINDLPSLKERVVRLLPLQPPKDPS